MLPQVAADADNGFVAVWQQILGMTDAAVESAASGRLVGGDAAAGRAPSGSSEPRGQRVRCDGGGLPRRRLLRLQRHRPERHVPVGQHRQAGATASPCPVPGSTPPTTSSPARCHRCRRQRRRVLAEPRRSGPPDGRGLRRQRRSRTPLHEHPDDRHGRGAGGLSTATSDLFSEVSGTEWQFGDGNTGSGDATSHTFAAAGTYSVTVTATDAAGNASTTSGTIEIAPAPAAQAPPRAPGRAFPTSGTRTCVTRSGPTRPRAATS